MYVNKLFIKKYNPKGNGFSIKYTARRKHYFLAVENDFSEIHM